MGRRLAGLSAAVLASAGFVSMVSMAPSARAADAKGVEFFEAKIRPILAQSCVRCHGEEKQKGGLRLDTRENLLKGGKEEEKVTKVIEPGDPAKSLIIEAVEYKNEDLSMPPPKKKVSQKLADDKIALLKEWVKMGAPYGDKPVEAVKE